MYCTAYILIRLSFLCFLDQEVSYIADSAEFQVSLLINQHRHLGMIPVFSLSLDVANNLCFVEPLGINNLIKDAILITLSICLFGPHTLFPHLFEDSGAHMLLR